MMCALPELDSTRRLRSPLFFLFSFRLFMLCLFSIVVLGAPPAKAGAAAATDAKPLHVYFIDVEGGQATLFVTPAHESLLIDTGWPGNDGRDADRIVATAKRAGLSQIDYVLITHFHADHGGGVPQSSAQMAN